MSEKKPVIGIFGQIEQPKDYIQPGYRRVAFNEDYVRAINEAGGIPMVIVPIEDHRGLEDQVKLCDGLFFIGGHDLHPSRYGEDPLPGLHEVELNRDAFEFLGLELALKYKKPCFGICRGMQLINAYFGGTLYQDIYSQVPTSIQHNQKGHIGGPSHKVLLTQDGFVAKALNQESLMTNSHHHQAVKDLAPGFNVVATASGDGCIEAIERKSQPFIGGVQWHPEMLLAYGDQTQLALFRYFVSQC
ncbi:MAG: gamma-glutamyl-gamma-aminobutyrate hydrolase family protein [Eubacteriales bacterium]|nr:gamma-glutamyl-gamma-aminobutyrate hydrolase family protein [Eubacteriales bacterium]